MPYQYSLCTFVGTEAVSRLLRAEEPPNTADLAAGGSEAVWVGNWCLPPDCQGLSMFGSSLVCDAFIARQHTPAAVLTH